MFPRVARFAAREDFAELRPERELRMTRADVVHEDHAHHAHALEVLVDAVVDALADALFVVRHLVEHLEEVVREVRVLDLQGQLRGAAVDHQVTDAFVHGDARADDAAGHRHDARVVTARDHEARLTHGAHHIVHIVFVADDDGETAAELFVEGFAGDAVDLLRTKHDGKDIVGLTELVHCVRDGR